GTRIGKLSLVVLEEKKLSATLQTNLEKQETENETFKQVITKFYDIKQNSLEKYDDDVNWEDKCTSLLNDSDDMWTFTEEEVEALRKSINNLRSRQQMGLEIEKHLKKMVNDLKKKKARCNLLVCSKEKMKSDTSDLRSYHSQHRMDIVNLLEEEASQFKQVVYDVKEYMRHVCVNEELKHVSLQTDMSLQENDCHDVHVSPDVGSDTITKELRASTMFILLVQLSTTKLKKFCNAQIITTSTNCSYHTLKGSVLVPLDLSKDTKPYIKLRSSRSVHWDQQVVSELVVKL
ncbi:hypothetical protein Tco_1413591, partial [Tanacetum coccineum]